PHLLASRVSESPADEARVLPSGVNASDSILPTWALRVASFWHVATSHKTMPAPPPTSVFPSGLKATHVKPSDSDKGSRSFPAGKSHRVIDPLPIPGSPGRSP